MWGRTHLILWLGVAPGCTRIPSDPRTCPCRHPQDPALSSQLAEVGRLTATRFSWEVVGNTLETALMALADIHPLLQQARMVQAQVHGHPHAM